MKFDDKTYWKVTNISYDARVELERLSWAGNDWSVRNIHGEN